MQTTHLIAIAGPSGSGKTTLALAIAGQVPGTPIISMDWYYRSLNHLDEHARAACNFDDPAMLDWPLLVSQLEALLRGETIDRPEYCFTTHTRLAGSEPVRPGAFVIIEGIFALHAAELRRLASAKIFVKAPDTVCFERRLERDVQERGRTSESVLRQYEATVRPSAERFILPTQAEADLTLAGDAAMRDNLAAAMRVIEHAAPERFRETAPFGAALSPAQ